MAEYCVDIKIWVPADNKTLAIRQAAKLMKDAKIAEMNFAILTVTEVKKR
jgi:hypothetical protein